VPDLGEHGLELGELDLGRVLAEVRVDRVAELARARDDRPLEPLEALDALGRGRARRLAPVGQRLT
jgi:hypothetical protein